MLHGKTVIFPARNSRIARSARMRFLTLICRYLCLPVSGVMASPPGRHGLSVVGTADQCNYLPSRAGLVVSRPVAHSRHKRPQNAHTRTKVLVSGLSLCKTLPVNPIDVLDQVLDLCSCLHGECRNGSITDIDIDTVGDLIFPEEVRVSCGGCGWRHDVSSLSTTCAIPTAIARMIRPNRTVAIVVMPASPVP